MELIDGELYYLAAPLTVHQEIQMIISAAFFNYIQANKGNCIVYPAAFIPLMIRSLWVFGMMHSASVWQNTDYSGIIQNTLAG